MKEGRVITEKMPPKSRVLQPYRLCSLGFSFHSCPLFSSHTWSLRPLPSPHIASSWPGFFCSKFMQTLWLLCHWFLSSICLDDLSIFLLYFCGQHLLRLLTMLFLLWHHHLEILVTALSLPEFKKCLGIALRHKVRVLGLSCAEPIVIPVAPFQLRLLCYSTSKGQIQEFKLHEEKCQSLQCLQSDKANHGT